MTAKQEIALIALLLTIAVVTLYVTVKMPDPPKASVETIVCCRSGP